MAVDFADGRKGTITQFEDGSPFVTTVCCPGDNKMVTVESDFFAAFIREMVDFFRTRKEKVPHEETINIMAVREAGLKAQQCPGEWVEV